MLDEPASDLHADSMLYDKDQSVDNSSISNFDEEIEEEIEEYLEEEKSSKFGEDQIEDHIEEMEWWLGNRAWHRRDSYAKLQLKNDRS